MIPFSHAEKKQKKNKHSEIGDGRAEFDTAM